jgi:hypothetical protein
MGPTRSTATAVAAIAMCAIVLSACGSSATAGGPSSSGTSASPSATRSPKPARSHVSPVPPESPVPAESNPPGDIPDSIAFVPYRSKAGGFKISTPEGWSRTTSKDSVTFTDKLNTIVVSWAPAASAPTVQSATSTEVPTLRKTVRAFRLVDVKAVDLPAGPSALISYQANSDPNAVTGKQYRQDILRYELFRRGEQVDITLLSPVGADNVDPWRIVTESFAWA